MNHVGLLVGAILLLDSQQNRQGDIFMKTDSFQTVIPESGMIQIPQHILENVVGHLTEIVIQEVDEEEKRSKVRSLRGKYRHVLSSTEEFSRRKVHEKGLEL